MAKQESIITLNGAIDNISFFKTKDGYTARKKTGVTAEEIATKAMMQVLAADITSPRGKRNLIDGDVELLQGFEFNTAGALSNTLLAPYTPAIDRATGICKITLPSYDPEKMIRFAAGATHYRFGITAAVVNFETPAKEAVSSLSGYLPVVFDAVTPTTLLELQATLPPNTTDPIFLAMTVEFVQERNGGIYALKSGDFNACALVKVESGV